MKNTIRYRAQTKAKYALLLGVFLLVPLISFQAHAASLNLFSSSSTKSTDLSAFAKWTRVVQQGQVSSAQDWPSLLSHPTRSNQVQTLKAINQQVNSYRYIEDKDGWKTPDYWATPDQFFKKGGGDCEDYAIVKYMALKALGWNPNNMRIVVLQDIKLNQLHSVLAVNFNGETYILDNQLSYLASDRDIRHYVPIYSINEHAWWRHHPSRKA
ncbi:MAG: transglutaminase-like cysteine peptidase [Rickettsiales bacterium]|nr:transglutaminase-like cysteine peptidase [Rickettsiales bacterium]